MKGTRIMDLCGSIFHVTFFSRKTSSLYGDEEDAFFYGEYWMFGGKRMYRNFLAQRPVGIWPLLCEEKIGQK
jgi:hypothetical protein